PSIITSTGSSLTPKIEITNSNSLSGTLLFHGRTLKNASAFNPNLTPVFSGTGGVPSTTTEITDMMIALRNIYTTGTIDVRSNTNITSLIATTNTGSLTTLGISLVKNELGGSGMSTNTNNNISETPLYTFTSHTFTNCGQTGRNGPNLVQCRISYSTSWDENSNFYNISTQGIQEFTVPENGTYRIEVVGANGGGVGSNYKSRGAKVVGDRLINKGEILYLSRGQSGEDTIAGTGDGIRYGGFNGGGNSCPDTNTPQGNCAGAGGSSDIRFGGNNIASRIMVAGGGGGACAGGTNAQGGNGGLNGYNGSSYGDISYAGKGGSQNSGGASTNTSHGGGEAGGLGYGGNGFTSCTAGGGGGGGGGYYGGSAGGGGYEGSGGGGSSFFNNGFTNTSYIDAHNSNQGYIIITKL
ncbi:MAG: glycine rich domain-containing protein, partial [Candidatus Gracilibacteria bacterium]|nr:glycine rich domain-containing protein [Candidatus Gracilibacteria bacterium]